ncbi:hypothetical protein C8R46DRAFT_418658 [Mycena filopes]|nr:hypothetical protein C8R46DRAFT_418658 [Mycena filopes]
MVSRPSSRASFSSGHHSVPESTFDGDPIEIIATSHQKPATLSSARRQEAHDHPRLDLTQVSASRGRASAPPKPVGKREARSAHERPEWNEPQPSVSRASSQRSRSRHPATAIKQEHVDSALDIKMEPQDGNLTNADSHDISLRRNNRGAVNLTQQHPDVQSLLGLALDYFLGFYLLKCAYPDIRLKTTFYQDALTLSARDLNLPLIEARLRQDAEYRSGLATVLSGRVSLWRGKVKGAALQVVHGHYHVQHDCAGLVSRLLDNTFQFGKPDNRRPYEHPAIPAVVSCFFKGPNSIAERVEAMFVRNPAGNLEASQAMVALACAGVHSTLEDFSTGEYKQSDFEGSRVQDIYEYHSLMEDIFNVASRGSSFAKGTNAPLNTLQQEALSMLDWSD